MAAKRLVHILQSLLVAFFMSSAPNTTERPYRPELRPEDFARYDMEMLAGRQAYLAGGSKSENPNPRDSEAWDWWREGYDQ